MWIIKFNGEFYKKFYQTRSRFLFGLKVFRRLHAKSGQKSAVWVAEPDSLEARSDNDKFIKGKEIFNHCQGTFMLRS